MKLMIVVTHLLGTGHLARALVLGRAFAVAGHDAMVVSGGMPAPHLDSSGVRVAQLPPVRSDGINFARLLDANSALMTENAMADRQDKLVQTLRREQPDVLITELYPFGRRVLAGEFTALLEAAKSMSTPPLVCCSIRDILAPPSKPKKAKTTRQVIAQYYDTVLVHSDPTTTRLDASWPVSPDIAARLAYTGYVALPPATDHPDKLGADEILVSAGGGNVGAALYAAALDAAHLSPRLKWRILIGGQNAADQAKTLQQQAPANILIEPARPEFRQMLRHAKASVSMCGYNTALDILQAGTPAVFVPFDDGGEVEQTLRATALSALNAINVLSARTLTGAALLQGVEAVLNAPARPIQLSSFDGAKRSVEIIEQRVNAR
ncbi:MAG: glycosyltransferase family protein [Roseobacter sp.]